MLNLLFALSYDPNQSACAFCAPLSTVLDHLSTLTSLSKFIKHFRAPAAKHHCQLSVLLALKFITVTSAIFSLGSPIGTHLAWLLSQQVPSSYHRCLSVLLTSLDLASRALA